MKKEIENLIKYWDDNIVKNHVIHEIDGVLEYFYNNNIDKINYIDIGANVGTYYDILCDKIEIKNVIMVEPVPYLYEYLIKKFKNKKNCLIYNFALSDSNVKTFLDSTDVIEHFINNDEIENLNLGISKLSDEEGIEINPISGFDFLKKYVLNFLDKIDFLKIDTENKDYNILNSISGILKNLKNKPFIVFENNYHDDLSSSVAKNIYVDFLNKCKYRGLDFEELSNTVYLTPLL